MVKHRIYIIGGKITGQGINEPTDKIFSFSIRENKFEIREEDLKLPVKIIKPACSIIKATGCIAGGLLETGEPNFRIFLIDFDKNSVRTLSIEIDRPLEDNYSIFLTEKGILCFSPPKLLFIKQDKEKLYSFSLPTNSSAFEMIFSKKNESNPIKKIFVDLSFAMVQNIPEKNEIKQVSSVKNSKNSEKKVFERFYSQKNSMVGKSLEFSEDVYSQSVINEEKSLNDDKNLLISQKIERFCHNSHLLIKNSKIEDKSCYYCSLTPDQFGFECKTCDFFICRNCVEIIPSLKKINSEYLKCFNNHEFYQITAKTEENNEKLSVCCNCNKEFFGINAECLKCRVNLCETCQKTIVLNAPNGEKLKCDKGHKLSWYLICDNLVNFLPKRHFCSICNKQSYEIGSFGCLNCNFYVCLKCCPGQYEKFSNNKETFLISPDLQGKTENYYSGKTENPIIKLNPIENSPKTPEPKQENKGILANLIAKLKQVDFKFIKDRENTKLDLSPLTPDGNFERDYVWYDFEIKRKNKRNKKNIFSLNTSREQILSVEEVFNRDHKEKYQQS